MKHLIYTLVFSLALSPSFSRVAIADQDFEDAKERRIDKYERQIADLNEEAREIKRSIGPKEKDLARAKADEREAKVRFDSCDPGMSGGGKDWKTPREDHGCRGLENDWKSKQRLTAELESDVMQGRERLRSIKDEIASIEEKIERVANKKPRKESEEDCVECHAHPGAPNQSKSGWEVFADVLKAATPLGLGAMGLYGGIQANKLASKDYQFYGNAMSSVGLPFAPPSNNYGGILGAAMGPAMWASLMMSGYGGGAGGMFGGPYGGGGLGLGAGFGLGLGGGGYPYGGAYAPYAMAAGIGAGAGFGISPIGFSPIGGISPYSPYAPYAMAAGIGAGVGVGIAPMGYSPIGGYSPYAPYAMAAGIGAGIGVGIAPVGYSPIGGISPYGPYAPYAMAAGIGAGIGVGIAPVGYSPIGGMSPYSPYAPYAMAAGIGVGAGIGIAAGIAPYGPYAPYAMAAGIGAGVGVGIAPWGVPGGGGFSPYPPMPYPSYGPGYPQTGFPGLQTPYMNPMYNTNPSCYGGMCNYNPYMSNMNSQFNNGGMASFYQNQQQQLSAQIRQLQQQALLSQDAAVAGQALTEAQNRYMSVVSQLQGSYYSGGQVAYGGGGYTQPLPFPVSGGGGNVTGNPQLTPQRQ